MLLVLTSVAPFLLCLALPIAVRYLTDSEYLRAIGEGVRDTLWGGTLLGTLVLSFRVYWEERRSFKMWESSG